MFTENVPFDTMVCMDEPTVGGLQTISGYEILQRIGGGGMGEVYLARQISLDRRVAVKFLTAVPAEFRAEQQSRFERETRLMARVSHPNIATVLDRGTSEPHLTVLVFTAEHSHRPRAYARRFDPMMQGTEAGNAMTSSNQLTRNEFGEHLPLRHSRILLC